MTSQGFLAATNPRWEEHIADEWSDALVASMKLGGINHFFFCSGSELAFYQEAIAKANHRGTPAPKLITMVHEAVALNAALGSSMVTGQPAATAVHVDVGTLAYGAGIHTAWRGDYPILMTAGTGPRAYPGSMAGAREGGVQWVQEPRDQAEIVRQYTKMDHRLEHQDNPGLMVSRLLQVAMSEPRGPVYLAVPQETARLGLPGTISFPSRDQMGVARPAWPDPADARMVAEWLIKSENPVILTAASGRNPESVEALVRLAELLAIPVMDTSRVSRMNFPANHPLYGVGPSPKDADVVVVFESPVPFTPPRELPGREAKIVWVDVDPVQSRYKSMEFDADLWLPASSAAVADAVYEAATNKLSKADVGRIEQRRARLQQRKQELVRQAEEQGQSAGKREMIHPRWVAYQLTSSLEREAIIVDDEGGFIRPYHGRDMPGTYFKSGSSSGGFGTGAAFGAKLEKPDQDIVLVSGDGFFMFGTPLAGLWAAAHHKAPFMSVVLVNASYSTGTSGLARQYPEGVAVGSDDYTGGVFDPPPNFAKLAEAANCSGEVVRKPEEVGPALQRAAKHVRDGTPALVAVMLPTIPQEMRMRGQ